LNRVVSRARVRVVPVGAGHPSHAVGDSVSRRGSNPGQRSHLSLPSGALRSPEPHHGTCCSGTVDLRRRRGHDRPSPLWGIPLSTFGRAGVLGFSPFPHVRPHARLPAHDLSGSRVAGHPGPSHTRACTEPRRRKSPRIRCAAPLRQQPRRLQLA
jgi:hypothetical protein